MKVAYVNCICASRSANSEAVSFVTSNLVAEKYNVATQYRSHYINKTCVAALTNTHACEWISMSLRVMCVCACARVCQ